MKRLPFILLAIAACGLLSSCNSKDSEPPHPERLSIFVSVGPQVYVLKNLAGDLVDINVLVGPGVEPHTFEPSPKQLAKLSESKVYFRIGVPFENRLVDKLRDFKNLQIVNVSGDAPIFHTHDDLDPHTWMSPLRVKQQAKVVSDTLCQIDPENRKIYQRNLEKLNTKLDALNQELSASLAPIRGKTFYVFHPAFGHFAGEYGLVQKAVETGGKSPSLKHVNQLIEQAKADGVKVIFVQPQFSRKASQSIAAQIGGVVIALDPLSEDYETNMRKIAKEIKQSIK